MKRKNFYSVLIAILALLFGAGGGTAWGQWLSPTGTTFVDPNSTPPNKQYTTSPINNAFGAGESSYITAGVHGKSNPVSTSRQKANAPWDVTVKAGTSFLWYKDHAATKPSPYQNIPAGMYSNELEDLSPKDILLGGVENTVIKAYTGNGYALGWISILNRTCATTCNYPDFPNSDYYVNVIEESYIAPHEFHTQSPSVIYEFSFNKNNVDNYGYTNWSDPSVTHNHVPNWDTKAPCGWGLFQARKDPNNIFKFWVSTHIMLDQYERHGVKTAGRPWVKPNYIDAEAFPADVPFGLYTSTVDGHYEKTWNAGHFHETQETKVKYPMDDKVPLVQFAGKDMVDGDALKKQSTYKLKSDAGHAKGSKDPDASPAWGDVTTTHDAEFLTNYRRPTTIVIEGNRNNAPSYHQFNQLRYQDIKWKYDIDTVKATSRFVQDLTKCCSGACSAYEFSVAWKAKTLDGATLVDGAIALQPNAWVCVENDVTDATSYPGSKHTGTSSPDAKTDAVLVFPDATTQGRFTLRVKGNIDHINMAQDKTSKADPFYTQEKFPVPAKDIFLYKDATEANAHEFAAPLLGVFKNNNPNAFITNHPIDAPVDPMNRAMASIFGVYGNYVPEGDTSHIHTDITSPAFNTNNPGVIELGPKGTGRGHLHAYSGGMVKNFEGCVTPQNFTMHFGYDNGTPDLKLTSTEPLYIMNYGNNDGKICEANIIFHHTIGSVDTVELAINGPYTGGLTQNKGALRIQALGNTEFRTDQTWTPGEKNNLLILSEAKNVVTQKITYTGGYADGIAEGLLTFWAEDTPPEHAIADCDNNWTTDRNSMRGNVYMNDEVSITRPNTSAGSTETNVIAANNVRTSKVTYVGDMAHKDTMNVISRKGDVYLGYSAKSPVYDSQDALVTGGNGKTADQNDFIYNATANAKDGELFIKAGFDDTKPEMTKTDRWEGGNVYFSRINAALATGASTNKRNTTITIPYSSEYICKDDLHKRAKESMVYYEHSGIIGGLGACGTETGAGYAEYAGKFPDAPALGSMTFGAGKNSIVYRGDAGDLTVDAGKRGNIIMNQGVDLNYQDNTGNAIFRTREGDIDMRDKSDAEKMKGGLLFLAQLENLGDLSKIGVCGCDEMRNNVYLQDFQYKAQGASGSVFIGADNNIKLNYGGLTNIGTRQDPFLSTDYQEKDGRVLKVGRGYNPNAADHCGTYFHCDLDSTENRARKLELFFNNASSGGFAAVASDMIDVYKDLIYKGGTGSGMSSVPGTGTLHGESVSGYGLFMKTQGNKKNWTNNVFRDIPKCPTDCAPTGCDNLKPGEEATGFLHNTVRMTFHSDARFRAENQRVHLESPVIETFGVLELNTLTNGGSNAQITVKTDSLICHDSMVIIGSSKVKLSSWSGLPNDQPIIKLGYSRKAAPFEEWAEENKRCRECVSHYKGKVYAKGETPLDTMFVKFGSTTELRRQNVMVIDHTVLSFLTDSFDHVKGGEVLNARYFVDTLKIRNQVEFWTDKMHERDGHLELISEQQMLSKDYAGMYTRHLHLEPIGACGRPSSELWLPGLALDVITYSTFGGFGTQYTDVHVENQANLNPGFTSLRLRGQCFEQRCGTLTMKDLRLDGGSNLNISVGTKKGLNGEYSDAVDVDMLTTYGPVNVNLEIRPCERIEKRCYPIIYYKSVSPNSLNALKLNPSTIKIDGDEYPLNLNISTDGVVYVCVGDAHAPGLSHTVTMPETSGVKTTPGKGIWSVPARGNFRFSATYSGQKPLVVRTNRMFNGQQEVLAGILNSNGEYEYIVPGIQQEVTLTFGPDAVANELLKGTAVWSHGEMIYIRVDRADIASIYSVAGQLVKRVDLPEGDTSIPMSRGAYVITLKDGSVHKVIVK